MTHRIPAATLAVCLIALTASAQNGPATGNLFRNGDFTEAQADGAPAGWQWRTATQGFVRTRPDADPPFVEIGVNQPGEDSFIQQDVKLPEDARRVVIAVKFRYRDIEKGERGYQTGKVQGRFTRNGKDFGGWIDLASVTGTSDGWIEKTRTAGVPKDANGVMLRLGMYGVRSGVVEVAEARLTIVTEADLAAERAKYRPAEAYGPPVSDERYNRLTHGININNWFCQPWNIRVNGKKGGFNAETFQSYITEHDIKMIADAGFDHIRLPVDPLFLMDRQTGELKTDLLPELDRAIAMIRAQGLAVIVDVHPKSNPFKKMRGKPVAEKFVPWWGRFARHLAETTDPEWVFLETLNEPGGQGFWVSSWTPYQDRLITAIRENAPDHTIIANGGAYMLAWELKHHDPHPDRNVIYAIHFYEPSPFTHQGAVWMKDWYRPLRSVPWPLTEANLDEAIASIAPNDKATKKAGDVLRDQLKSGWGTQRGLRERFEEVAAWSAEHDRRVVVGEWGVYVKYAPRESRLSYLRAVAQELARRGFGWSKWDYCGGGFQIVEDPAKPSGQRTLDSEVIAALGVSR